MNNKRNIFIDILIMSVLVAFAVVMFFLVAPSKELKAQENESVVNLASPHLEGKEYLGNGLYTLYNENDIILVYNVFNGIYSFNGTIEPGMNIGIAIGEVSNWIEGTSYTSTLNVLSSNAVSGSIWFETFTINTGGNYSPYWNNSTASTLNGGSTSITLSNQNNNSFNLRLMKTNQALTTFNDWQFTLQIEKGNTATDYQASIEALEQHFSYIYDNGYNNGYDNGFDDGLDQAFNSNNLITSTDYTILERGQAGPNFDFFGLYFDNVNIKVKDIMLLNLSGTSLQNIDVGYSGSYQNITLRFTDNTSKTFYFRDYYDSFESLMLFNNDNDKLVKSITISLLATPSMSYPDFEALLNNYKRTLGLYLNNRILSDEAIDTFKEIIENDLRNELEIEYQNELNNLLDFYLKAEFDKGYEKGVNESDTTYTGVFTIITNAIFKPIALIFGIELLPNISLGMIILVPLLFGLIAFVVGGKKK